MLSKEKFNSDLKEAMKSGDGFRVGVLRFIIAAINNKEIELRSVNKEAALSEEELKEVLSKEAKKRKEAAVFFDKGDRRELAEKERRELSIIETYLPKQFSREETEKAVAKIMDRENISDFGRAMGRVLKDLKGKADSALVAESVKNWLEKKKTA